MRHVPQWVCTSAGATEWLYRGRRYLARHAALALPDVAPLAGSLYWSHILVPLVGTLRCVGEEYRGEYPPAEVARFFPDYVPARLVGAGAWPEIEYQGAPPNVRRDAAGNVVPVKLLDGYEWEERWSIVTEPALA